MIFILFVSCPTKNNKLLYPWFRRELTFSKKLAEVYLPSTMVTNFTLVWTVCNTMWVARQADDSFVCFGAKPDKGFWTWNLAVIGSGRGREKRVGWIKELTGSWQRDTDRGGRQWTPEQRGEAAWDRVQRRRSSQNIGIPVALWNFL